MKKIFLTGATGFIGSHLLEKLLAKKYEIVITKRNQSDTWRIDHLLDQVEVCDIDGKSLNDTFEKNEFNCVVHLATNYIKNHENHSQVKGMIEDNVVFPSVLADSAVRHGVKNFINTGTFFEYKTKNQPLKETDAIEPCNFYAATKVSFGEILKYYCQQEKLRVFDLKLFAPYGEKDNPKLIDFLINSLENKKPIDFSGGEQQWNFTYVKDIVEAYLLAIEKINSAKGYEIFNIGTDETNSLTELAGTLEKISGKKLNINWGAKPYVKNEILYANCDNSKAREILGWNPRYDLEEGLKLTYDYYLNKS